MSEPITWVEADQVAKAGLLDMEARRDALAEREAERDRLPEILEALVLGPDDRVLIRLGRNSATEAHNLLDAIRAQADWSNRVMVVAGDLAVETGPSGEFESLRSQLAEVTAEVAQLRREIAAHVDVETSLNTTLERLDADLEAVKRERDEAISERDRAQRDADNLTVMFNDEVRWRNAATALAETTRTKLLAALKVVEAAKAWRERVAGSILGAHERPLAEAVDAHPQQAGTDCCARSLIEDSQQ